MNTIRPCGCKGVRSCLKCESDFAIEKPQLHKKLQQLEAWSYCVACEKFYEGWDTQIIQDEHPNHIDKQEKCRQLPGVFVQECFLSQAEANTLVQRLDALPWTVSQSGRRKQNFGPRTNFKKRKLHLGAFCGFPAGTEFVQQKFKNVALLSDFQTIEQCSLEYDAAKGASIDPHIDDCWVWGERVVTVNCLGDSVLTLTLFEENQKIGKCKYNLDLVADYEKDLLLPFASNIQTNCKNCVFRIPMPSRSLIVLYGPARYQLEHCVLREDIISRRVCIAYREFTPMYINGKDAAVGATVIEAAKIFWPDEKNLLMTA